MVPYLVPFMVHILYHIWYHLWYIYGTIFGAIYGTFLVPYLVPGKSLYFFFASRVELRRSQIPGTNPPLNHILHDVILFVLCYIKFAGKPRKFINIPLAPIAP